MNNRLKIINTICLKKSGRKRTYYVCECTCGKTVKVEKYKYQKDLTKSCGCLKRDLLLQRVTKHGLYSDKLYHLFHQIKNRCYNKNNKDYKYYGGKGVVVFKDWLDDVSLFINWCKNTNYTQGLTIDRINVNGNYEPDNCQWVTIQEQQTKRRNTNVILVDGELSTLRELSNKYNKNLGTVRSNFYRLSKDDFINWITYKIKK